MRPDDPPIAIVCADLHLSADPPVARRAELTRPPGFERTGWYEAMGKSLDQLGDLQDQLGVPILCAGDIFDRWNSPASLINFALSRLPGMFAVPGQHDLPFHRMDLMRDSAFWTLCMAKRIRLLPPEGTQVDAGITVHGFGWGQKIRPPGRRDGRSGLRVAVIHRFIWSSSANSYTGATSEFHIKSYRKDLAGYDVAVFGDNHKGFGVNGIFNCGALMRRKADERGYHPRVGLLCRSGRVIEKKLDIREDLLEVPVETRSESNKMESLVSHLRSLQSDPLDFLAVLKDRSRHVSPGVRRAVAEVLP